MTGTCSRCGRVGEVEYGSDGLAYCSSCSFYGFNKQCGRCRMYVPATELQQYRGIYACPNCIQDLRAEDQKAIRTQEEKHKLEVLQYPEQCERCGRDLNGRVYIWNGKKLCKKCVEQEQDELWGVVGGGPSHAPQRITLKPEQERKGKSTLEHTISEMLIFLRLKKRPIREVYLYDTKMPIQYAKPMAEKPFESKSSPQKPRPQAEGIIKEEHELKGTLNQTASKPKPEPGAVALTKKSEQPFEFEQKEKKPEAHEVEQVTQKEPDNKIRRKKKPSKKRPAQSKKKEINDTILDLTPVKTSAGKK